VVVVTAIAFARSEEMEQQGVIRVIATGAERNTTIARSEIFQENGWSEERKDWLEKEGVGVGERERDHK
jgi:hypothetical protein